MASSRASTPGFATNCLMERSCTPWARPKSWSKAGGATTTPRGRTVPGLQAASAWSHPRLRSAGGSATPISDAARASREATDELAFALDQSLGADQRLEW